MSVLLSATANGAADGNQQQTDDRQHADWQEDKAQVTGFVLLRDAAAAAAAAVAVVRDAALASVRVVVVGAIFVGTTLIRLQVLAVFLNQYRVPLSSSRATLISYSFHLTFFTFQ